MRVLPAHAGMSRVLSITDEVEKGAPRTRGDESVLNLIPSGLFLCSPHTRG